MMIKDPDARLDFRLDWSAWLADGETITDATVTEDNPDDSLTVEPAVIDGTTVSVWVSGGTTSTRYPLVCHIVTSEARQDDRTITLNIQQR